MVPTRILGSSRSPHKRGDSNGIGQNLLEASSFFRIKDQLVSRRFDRGYTYPQKSSYFCSANLSFQATRVRDQRPEIGVNRRLKVVGFRDQNAAIIRI